MLLPVAALAMVPGTWGESDGAFVNNIAPWWTPRSMFTGVERRAWDTYSER